jgi:hypothetical protein
LGHDIEAGIETPKEKQYHKKNLNKNKKEMDLDTEMKMMIKLKRSKHSLEHPINMNN